MGQCAIGGICVVFHKHSLLVLFTLYSKDTPFEASAEDVTFEIIVGSGAFGNIEQMLHFP